MNRTWLGEGEREDGSRAAKELRGEKKKQTRKEGHLCTSGITILLVNRLISNYCHLLGI